MPPSKIRRVLEYGRLFRASILTIVIGEEIAWEGRRGPAARRMLGYRVPVVGQ